MLIDNSSSTSKGGTDGMPRRSDARERAIRTASRLFNRQGFNGTGLSQIIDESGSPKGSFYFHFPGGKEELAREAIESGSQEVLDLLTHARKRARGDAVQFVSGACRGLSRWLSESDYEAGCPVTSIVLEMGSQSETLREACERAFAAWIDAARLALIDGGVDGAAAPDLATGFVAAFEGAFVLARAQRSPQPFDVVKTTFSKLLDTE